MKLSIKKIKEISKQYGIKFNDLEIEINGKFSLYLKDNEEKIYYEKQNY